MYACVCYGFYMSYVKLLTLVRHFHIIVFPSFSHIIFQHSVSQTLIGTQINWRPCQNAHSDSIHLE